MLLECFHCTASPSRFRQVHTGLHRKKRGNESVPLGERYAGASWVWWAAGKRTHRRRWRSAPRCSPAPSAAGGSPLGSAGRPSGAYSRWGLIKVQGYDRRRGHCPWSLAVTALSPLHFISGPCANQFQSENTGLRFREKHTHRSPFGPHIGKHLRRGLVTRKTLSVRPKSKGRVG